MSSTRFARWLYWVYPWIDKGAPDDSQRYESMPTPAVAELASGLKVMHRRIEERGGYAQPWMPVQSLDDSSTLPIDNQAFLQAQVLKMADVAIGRESWVGTWRGGF